MSTTTWSLDPTHSEIQFKVKHMMISTVSGEFGQFHAELKTEGDDFTQATARLEADINSITTKNEQRDEHLKSADFFDASNHPKLVFESTSIEKKDEENYTLNGNLSIRGVTHPVTLQVVNSGIIKDPYGNMRTGFEISGKINRKDFGLSWSALTEAGGLVVSDEVRLLANVEFIHQ